jgi:hypothetical protein
VLTNARRQVVIEATIAEVSLSDNYQQGINWQSLRTLRQVHRRKRGFSAAQNPTGIPVPNPFTASSGSFATVSGSTPGAFAFLLNYVAPGTGSFLDAQPAGNLRQGQSPVQPEDQRPQQPDGNAQGRGQRGVLPDQKRLNDHDYRYHQQFHLHAASRYRSAWS